MLTAWQGWSTAGAQSNCRCPGPNTKKGRDLGPCLSLCSQIRISGYFASPGEKMMFSKLRLRLLLEKNGITFPA